MIKLNGRIVTPTIFPDKTSQIWKLQDELFIGGPQRITWEFENEAELLHVAQLKDLIDATWEFPITILDMPYLPYARQDKEISNTTAFALYSFAKLLNALEFDIVEVYDPHNLRISTELINNLKAIAPDPDSLAKLLASEIIYPDFGAAVRYKTSFNSIICNKNRDPLTGEIARLNITGQIESKSYLIVDDLCDGGRTFIEVAKKLYEAGATEVHLYVSHGIFSKGLQVLRDVGIKRIFTYKGEVL